MQKGTTKLSSRYMREPEYVLYICVSPHIIDEANPALKPASTATERRGDEDFGTCSGKTVAFGRHWAEPWGRVQTRLVYIQKLAPAGSAAQAAVAVQNEMRGKPCVGFY